MLEFIHLLEKLKKEMRHSYISDGRQEDVAQHSWRMALMAILLKPDNVNLDKCINMALIHDIPEAISGDVFALDVKAKEGKKEREESAMKQICAQIPDERLAKEFMDLWQEYETASTPEARFVKLLDKFEVLIQHNESPIDTWADIEKKTHFGMAEQHAAHYGLLANFGNEIDQETFAKLKDHGLNPSKLTREEYLHFFGR